MKKQQSKRFRPIKKIKAMAKELHKAKQKIWNQIKSGNIKL